MIRRERESRSGAGAKTNEHLRNAAALERRHEAAAVWSAIVAERHAVEDPTARLRAMLLAPVGTWPV